VFDLITDEELLPTGSILGVESLKNSLVKIYSIGIGSLTDKFQHMLYFLASHPKDKHYFKVQHGYTFLEDMQNDFKKSVCSGESNLFVYVKLDVIFVVLTLTIIYHHCVCPDVRTFSDLL